MKDFKLALRSLAKTPGFTLVAILTLTLAIGVNSGLFALVHATVLRPLVPVPADEIVNLFNGRADSDRDYRAFTHPEFQALRQAGAPLQDVAAFTTTQAGIETNGNLRRSTAYFVSENFFSLLGLQPAAGRVFAAEECAPGAGAPVLMVSHAFWQAQGGTADFVGRSLRVNGRNYTVVGVAPRGFNGLSAFGSVDVWAPLGLMGVFNSSDSTNLALPSATSLLLTARLAPGTTPEALRAKLAGLNAIVTASAANPTNAPRVLVAERPTREGISNAPRGGDATARVGAIVLAMSAGVLVVACLNLANLFLARGARRAKEIAIRAALGGSRWQVVRRLLLEGFLIALAGGALGLAVATWGNAALMRAFQTMAGLHGESLAIDVSPSATVFLVTLGLCVAATLLFSLAPALQASRVDLVSALKQSRSDASSADRFRRFFSLRHCLVMAQIALSLALLFSAALFFRGALSASRIEPGFSGDATLVAQLDYSLTPLSRELALRSAFSLTDRLATEPGVRAAALATFVPYSSRTDSRGVRTGDAAPDARGVPALSAGITEGYFDSLGVRLLEGRSFLPTEVHATERAQVAIIDEGLAKRLFPNASAVGKQIRFGSQQLLEVVGVCAAHRHTNRNSNARDRVFVPYGAVADGRPYALIGFQPGLRVDAQVEIARRAMRAIDPELPLLQLTAMRRLIEQDLTTWVVRLGAAVFGFFGVLALTLAVVGVYSVKSYAVLSRTHEIGIRLALGAQRDQILRLFLRQGAWQVGFAAAAGLDLALAVGKVVSRFLYEVSGSDPLALLASAGVLVLAALAACVVPALRATRVSPLVAIRTE